MLRSDPIRAALPLLQPPPAPGSRRQSDAAGAPPRPRVCGGARAERFWGPAPGGRSRPSPPGIALRAGRAAAAASGRGLCAGRTRVGGEGEGSRGLRPLPFPPAASLQPLRARVGVTGGLGAETRPPGRERGAGRLCTPDAGRAGGPRGALRRPHAASPEPGAGPALLCCWDLGLQCPSPSWGKWVRVPTRGPRARPSRPPRCGTGAEGVECETCARPPAAVRPGAGWGAGSRRSLPQPPAGLGAGVPASQRDFRRQYLRPGREVHVALFSLR